MQLIYAWAESPESRHTRWRAAGMGATSECPSTPVAVAHAGAKLSSFPWPELLSLKATCAAEHLPMNIQNRWETIGLGRQSLKAMLPGAVIMRTLLFNYFGGCYCPTPDWWRRITQCPKEDKKNFYNFSSCCKLLWSRWLLKFHLNLKAFDS